MTPGRGAGGGCRTPQLERSLLTLNVDLTGSTQLQEHPRLRDSLLWASHAHLT